MNRSHLLALLAVPSIPIMFFACSGGGTNVAPSDAGLDASALLDASFSQPDRNVENPDAGEWSWLPGDPTRWITPPGLPNICEVRMAKTPAQDLPALPWEACPSGRVGCTRLVMDWSPPVKGGRQSVVQISNPVFRTRSGETFLHYQRQYPSKKEVIFDRLIDVVYPLGGPAVFALAADVRGHGGETGSTRCFPSMSVGNGGHAFFVWLNPEQRFIFATAPWTNPLNGTYSREFTRAEFRTFGPGLISNDGNLVYGAVYDLGSTSIIDVGANTLTFPKEPSGAISQLEDAKPVQGGFVAFGLNTQVQLDFVRPDGTSARLARAPGARHICGFAIDRTDAESLVWVESDTIQPASNTVLFTAPRATSEASLVRRRVTAFDDTDGLCGGRMIANGGYALIRVSNTEAKLFRLSDGAGWTIAAEPGTVFVKEMWVDSTDVWLATGIQPFLPGSESVYEDGIVRISRASLGPPTIPPQ